MAQENNKIKNNIPDEEAKFSKPSNIRTFRDDTSALIKKEDLSLSEIFIKQQKKSRLKQNDSAVEMWPPETRSRKKGVLISLLIFVFLAAGASAFWFFVLKNNGPAPVPTSEPPTPSPLLISQETAPLEFKDKESFKNQMKTMVNTRHSPGDLVFTPIKIETEDGEIRYVNSKEFLGLLETKASGLVTSFLKDNFFLGTLNLAENHPVLILEIEKQHFDTVFSGFLRWEKNILQDMDFITGQLPVPVSKLLFTDKIIKNQNVRAVEMEGNTVFLYTFLNKQYVIITNSPRALEELLRQFVIFSFS